MKAKILKLMLFLSCFIVSSCNAQCDNKNAIEKFRTDLDLIRSSLNNPDSNQKDLPILIDRIEKITSIESISDGNYLGKFHPTETDIKKWEEWFRNNKTDLCWKNNKFYLKN